MKRALRDILVSEVFFMSQPKKRVIQPVVCPAGQRADRLGDHNIPYPDEMSVAEEYQWRREHIQ